MTARNRRRRPRRRLPRHLAWSLTTTDVNESLGELVSHIRELRFLTGSDSGTSVLGARWVASDSPNYGRGVDPDYVGFSVDVHPVDAAERAATRAVLKETALPQLHAWITQGLAAPETWRQTSHLRYWHLTDGHLGHADEET
ncbi:hypothetical protein ACKI1I_38570 [Streptomyces turgidiscabies]|uniref:Uncharacterized protein n=1 Tax=Streptomyces turgidiscabies (strain Car8) TaxID=698760 RepID=L7FH85_STRT8|nr:MULTISPECIES: hypothetical protein [Streptomyces]ELP70677.1 hypothetical protein STRTUCAR8_04271 [Streptomyces turgidiscabies Car8]MDX3496026.1 hypothetical protein [Streptomyces turgidiscabies]GAQ72485.1 hypothetical protein T45_04237 [Streptomyces turgidiscabies]